MAGLDLTAFDSMLKEWYSQKRVESMVYKDNAFLSLVPKSNKFPGRNMPIPILYGNPQTTSASFTTAQTAASSYTSKVEQFTLTRVKRYGVAIIDGETLKATESDDGAFLKAATTEIDGVIHQLKRNIAVNLFRTGWGSIGVIGSGYNSTSVTLSRVDDVTNFEVGQVLKFATAESGGTLRSGTVSVSGVNRSTGVLTLSAAPSSLSVAANGEYIFLDGDANMSTRQSIAGLEDWCPQTAPTSTAFFGVDRSVDTNRLGGQRLDASDGRPLEEALIDGAALVGREGFGITHYFMNFGKWAALEKSLHGKVVMSTEKGSGNFGFNAITLRGPKGDIKCVADQNCPSDRIFGVNFDYLKLHSLGPLVRTIDDDGNMLMRSYNADAVESRHGFMGNLACTAPASLLNIKVAA